MRKPDYSCMSLIAIEFIGQDGYDDYDVSAGNHSVEDGPTSSA